MNSTNRLRVGVGRIAAGILAILICLAASARAAATIKGDVAPNFTLKTLEGKPVELAGLTAKGRVVLVVLRGWPGYQCPACEGQVHDFISAAAQFKEQKAQVVFVYPGPGESLMMHAKEFLQDKSWPADFIFITDPDYMLTDAYGLRWNAPNETAYPSTFIVDQGAMVRYAHVGKSHGDRVKAAAVLKALSKLN